MEDSQDTNCVRYSWIYSEVLGKGICRDTLRKVLQRHGIAKIVIGTPIEEKRSHVLVRDLEEYYENYKEIS